MKYSLLAVALTTAAASGSTLVIIAQNEFGGFSSNPLQDETCTTGLTSTDAVQFGYFELADGPAADGDLFSGFVEIGAVSIALSATGTYSQSINLSDTDLAGTSSQTVQFGIRFFNDSTPASSTFYNTVTNPNWQFTFSPDGTVPAPTDSEMFLDPVAGTATIATAVWEGGTASAFCTTVSTALVPEPSSSLTLLLGSALLLGSRRRK